MYYKSRGYSLEFKEVYAAMNGVLQIISRPFLLQGLGHG